MTEEIKETQNLNKLGIHWVGNAVWAQTGYGGQAKLLLPRFAKLGHQPSMTAYYGLQGHMLQINNMNVFPMGYHPYGMDVCASNAQISRARILMTCLDVWVCEPQMFTGDVLWVPWYPIDSETVNTGIKAKLPAAFDMIAMSKFGQRKVEELGLKTHYAPCCVDTTIFAPADRETSRVSASEQITAPLPKDAFIVSMVAMNKGNPSRKAFYEQFRAFRALHNKHPDTVLYAHTITSEAGQQGGVNLLEICAALDLKVGVDIIFPNALAIINGYQDTFLNSVYNASDVLLSVTMGEGFGIPIIEAQAAGCPVIIGDWTSMSELKFSGWSVDKSEASEFWTPLNAIQYLPKWEAIADRLEMAYQMRGNMDYRKRARKGALAYDCDKVLEKHWVPILAEIDAKVKERPTFTVPV
jgi:glycosyltransferase involved in cell wall biosynthesis